ncbi:hypothetical protein ACTTAL_15645 [Rhodobacter capsulatus]|nr:hypothetical protein [Rhodobacter capsulatus]
MDDTKKRVIYTASIRLKNNRRIFAKHYGLRAFRIEVSDNDDQPRLPGI